MKRAEQVVEFDQSRINDMNYVKSIMDMGKGEEEEAKSSGVYGTKKS